MSELKTTYKDDVLDASANTRRKFEMITNDDGTVSFVDKTVYSQTGDTFGAADINVITELINESVPKSTTVKNVELVTELPATGTEGTVYFTYEG